MCRTLPSLASFAVSNHFMVCCSLGCAVLRCAGLGWAGMQHTACCVSAQANSVVVLCCTVGSPLQHIYLAALCRPGPRLDQLPAVAAFSVTCVCGCSMCLLLSPGFRHRPFSFHMQAINWLRQRWVQGMNAVLADDQGLGRTATVITFLQCLRCVICSIMMQLTRTHLCSIPCVAHQLLTCCPRPPKPHSR